MKNLAIIFCLIFFILFIQSCKKENTRIISNTTTRIKSIKRVNHYSATDSSIIQFDFYYKTNGLLDSIAFNDITVFIVDSANISYNNLNLIQEFIDKKTNGVPDYLLTDSIKYVFNSNGFIESLEKSHTETDVCLNKLANDSFYYNNENNLVVYINNIYNSNCTPGSYFTESNICNYVYDVSKINSLTNENIGMPYCGKSSVNVIDSLSIENCNDRIQPNSFNCNTLNLKVINIYDTQGRIIKTNVIPSLGFIMFVNTSLTLMVSTTNDLYEISYY